jgi:hypothetical protein
MIGSQHYQLGWERFFKNGTFLPAFTHRLATTGNAPLPRPSKTHPRHFNNHCTGFGQPKRFFRKPPGQVWRNSRPQTFCDDCGKLCGPRYSSRPSEADLHAGKPYGRTRRLCVACYKAEWRQLMFALPGPVLAPQFP